MSGPERPRQGVLHRVEAFMPLVFTDADGVVFQAVCTAEEARGVPEDLLVLVLESEGGASKIAGERVRQVAKGYTPTHDRARHTVEELAVAAEAFVHLANGCPGLAADRMAQSGVRCRIDPAMTRDEALVAAGAMIAAALDRSRLRPGQDG